MRRTGEERRNSHELGGSSRSDSEEKENEPVRFQKYELLEEEIGQNKKSDEHDGSSALSHEGRRGGGSRQSGPNLAGSKRGRVSRETRVGCENHGREAHGGGESQGDGEPSRATAVSRVNGDAPRAVCTRSLPEHESLDTSEMRKIRKSLSR